MCTRVCWVAVVGLTAAAIGCGGGKAEIPAQQKTVPASGKVTYKGKPVGDADIAFQSADGKVSARGRTDAAGLFTLTTYTTGDGAPVGLYKVMVAVNITKKSAEGDLLPLPLDKDGNPLPSATEAGKSPIPTKYASLQSTDLSADVKADGSNVFSFELK